MSADDVRYLRHLPAIAAQDVSTLQQKEQTYRGSWKKRGGVGAFMMLARKWDRLENITSLPRFNYDVFEAIAVDPTGADGTVLAEIRDLRCYLMLVEAEMRERMTPRRTAGAEILSEAAKRMLAEKPDSTLVSGEVPPPGTPEDGGHHELQLGLEDHVIVAGPAERGARLDDGLTRREDLVPGYPYLETAPGYYVVDRRTLLAGEGENLPRLRLEMTAHEHSRTPPYYRPMYRWHETSHKWILEPKFVEEWGPRE